MTCSAIRVELNISSHVEVNRYAYFWKDRAEFHLNLDQDVPLFTENGREFYCVCGILGVSCSTVVE